MKSAIYVSFSGGDDVMIEDPRGDIDYAEEGSGPTIVFVEAPGTRGRHAEAGRVVGSSDESEARAFYERHGFRAIASTPQRIRMRWSPQM
jgi:hypothetical protein